MFQVLEGDCLEVLKTMSDCSVDAVVTDPPYGLSQHTPEQVKDCLLAWCKGEIYQPKGKGFMGKTWDAWVPGPEVWKEVLRVLKPGGHALVFAGTRSMDLMSMSLRLAGFELRDSIGHAYDDSDSDSGAAPLLAWVHGQGFPKNLDIGKAIDKLHGAEREVVGRKEGERYKYNFNSDFNPEQPSSRLGSGDAGILTKPATPDAEKWDGFGTAIKPSWEPILLCRKPLASSCINVLGMIESQLRKQGVTGDILWKPESARDAAKSKKTTNSDSIKHSEPSVTSAKTAAENETQKTGLQTQRNSGTLGTNGIKQIQEGNENSRENLTETCENKSSQPTVGSVSAAEKLSTTSLPLTTSTEGEHSTANKSTEKSTPNCGVKDFHPDTESFAGIVTGLTGSMATVHISRDSDGMFLWPTGLPKNIPSKTLTVAENVLKHGTGGLNIGACRIGTDGEQPRGSGCRGASSTWDNQDKGMFDAGRQYGGNLTPPAGRWPANVVLTCSCEGDHSESCPVSQFPEAGGMSASRFFQIFDMVDDNDFFMYNSEVNVAINMLCGNITENQKIVSMFTGAIKAVERFIVVVEPFISGSNITESCQKDIVSTIETVTQWMTELKTLNVLPLKSTISFMRESEKTIKWLMEQNTDAVNSANNISHLIAFKQEALELIRDTAKSVLESHCKIGEAKTGKSTTHICENTVGVSRLKYTAKASKRDRDEGLENLPKTVTDDGRNKSIDNPYQRGETLRHNPHPTVKATPLMRWLCRLICPPGGVILDPFCGSGSTGKAAVPEGFDFIGIEQDPESVQVARARIAYVAENPEDDLSPAPLPQATVSQPQQLSLGF